MHPLKNLNACGDGGFVTTNNFKLADYISKRRNHGHLLQISSRFRTPWIYTGLFLTIWKRIIFLKQFCDFFHL